MLIWQRPEEPDVDEGFFDSPIFRPLEAHLDRIGAIRTTAVVPDRYRLFLHCGQILEPDAAENGCTITAGIGHFKTEGVVRVRGDHYRPDREKLSYILHMPFEVEIVPYTGGTFSMDVTLQGVCRPIEWEEPA